MYRTLELDPHFGNAHGRLGQVLRLTGQGAEVVEHFLQFRRPLMSEQQLAAVRLAYSSSSWKGFLQKRAEFLRENRKRTYVPGSIMALQYAHLGDQEKTLEWLERA